MIAIVEAYDAMTTDHVFRKAMSPESAIHELFRCAGTQFDPELVEKFAEFQAEDQSTLWQDTTDRWLRTLDPEAVESYWQFGPAAGGGRGRRRRDAVPRPAAGQHARRGGVRRRQPAGEVVEPRRGAADGHFEQERLPSASGCRSCLNLRDEKGDARRRNGLPGGGHDPVRGAVAAAADDLAGAAGGRCRSTATSFP